MGGVQRDRDADVKDLFHGARAGISLAADTDEGRMEPGSFRQGIKKKSDAVTRPPARLKGRNSVPRPEGLRVVVLNAEPASVQGVGERDQEEVGEFAPGASRSQSPLSDPVDPAS